jgi:hypothetical protein
MMTIAVEALAPEDDDTDADDVVLLLVMDEETDVLLPIAEPVVDVELLAIEVEDDVDAELDVDPEAVETDVPVPFTVMVPFIQAGCMEQS